MFCFAPCVTNGKLILPCGVFKDHFYMAKEIIPGKAYEIKGVIILGRGRQGVPCREPCGRSAQ